LGTGDHLLFKELFGIAIVASTPLLVHVNKKIRSNPAALKVLNVAEPAVLMGLLLWTTGFLVDGSFNPFLYFRF